MTRNYLFKNRRRWHFNNGAGHLITFLCLSLISPSPILATDESTCQRRASSQDHDDIEPSLKPMAFKTGNGDEEQTTLVYDPPDISSWYREPPGTRQAKSPLFKGFAGKFINLSPLHLVLSWLPSPDDYANAMVIENTPPFTAAGTATFPGHIFYFHQVDEPLEPLIQFTVVSSTQQYAYDPHDRVMFGDEAWDVDELTPDERPLYDQLKLTMTFSVAYKERTGRDYHSLYPRQPPIHRMWRGDYFGQTHWVTTNETHFREIPSMEELGLVKHDRTLDADERRLLSEYREPGDVLNLTMTVVSCAPRVFEIEDFLSSAEVDHVLRIVDGNELKRSQTGTYTAGFDDDDIDIDDDDIDVNDDDYEVNNDDDDVDDNDDGIDVNDDDVFDDGDDVGSPRRRLTVVDDDGDDDDIDVDIDDDDDDDDESTISETRTSRNTWIQRAKDPIIDAIYRRTADLLGIDEGLLRGRFHSEDKSRYMPSIAEPLQLVHYAPGQEYTAHHDWGYPPTNEKNQPARFATVLLYLNEGMGGGETSFPRWVNAETEDELKVVPKKGKAVLFYSFLPDGNMDDLSQHAALPVTHGEKWLMNLWVWDPIYGSY